MTHAEIYSYFLTVLVIALAPGPVVLMLIVRSASNDISGAAGFGIGYALGGVIIVTAVCFGLGTWLTAVPEVFEYSKYVMILYILWLARGIWKGGFDLSQGGTVKTGSIASALSAGLMTCFLSPYMMILFPLVLPEMMNLSVIEMPDFLIVSLTTFVGLVAASGIVVVFAAQLRRLARSPRGMVLMNRALSGMLVCGGGSMVLL